MPTERKCGICRELGHNRRSCPHNVLSRRSRPIETTTNMQLRNLTKARLQQISIHYFNEETKGTKDIIQQRIIEHRDQSLHFNDAYGSGIPGSVQTNFISRRIQRQDENNIFPPIYLNDNVKFASMIELCYLYACVMEMNQVWRRGRGASVVQTIQREVIPKLENIKKIWDLWKTGRYWPVSDYIPIPVGLVAGARVRGTGSRMCRRVCTRKNIIILIKEIFAIFRSEHKVWYEHNQRKTIQIQNLTSNKVFVYVCVKKPEPYPEIYNECKFIRTIQPGLNQIHIPRSTLKFNIIVSSVNNGPQCYYGETPLGKGLKSDILFEDIANDINSIIEIKKNYTELEKWREAALKGDYLLKQLIRLGIGENETYEPIIDLHQDIILPEHTESDKEIAGIPSVFTNIT